MGQLCKLKLAAIGEQYMGIISKGDLVFVKYKGGLLGAVKKLDVVCVGNIKLKGGTEVFPSITLKTEGVPIQLVYIFTACARSVVYRNMDLTFLGYYADTVSISSTMIFDCNSHAVGSIKYTGSCFCFGIGAAVRGVIALSLVPLVLVSVIAGLRIIGVACVVV